MADRPMASTSRAGRPRMGSRSAHLPMHACIPVASKAAKPRAKSVHRAQVKGKGKSTSDKKKLGKAAIVISSDSEESSGEVDSQSFSPKPACRSSS